MVVRPSRSGCARASCATPAALISSLLLAFPVAASDAGPRQANATLLQAIVVNAEQDDFDARRDARSTKLVYGREELDRMNELTVGDYLRRMPSVTFTGPPGNPKDVRVRGMDKGYTQILIDGEPVSTGTKERQIQVDRIPLDLVERIELIRAPSAAMPGEGLIGTINIVLREPPERRIANARAVTGRLFGEKADRDTWNLSGQYGDATGDLRWLVNASAGQRADLKTKSKDETAFANDDANLASSRKLEFEDERVRSDTIDFSPRLTLRLSAHDELILTPWITRSDERKVKTRDKRAYVGAPFTDPATLRADGHTREAEDKLRETARVRGEWRRALADGALSVYAAVQQGGEDKDKTVLDRDAAGALAKVTVERDDKDEREWYVGVRAERAFGAHKWSGGLEHRDLSRRDRKTRQEGRDAANLAVKDPGRGDRFDIDERRWIAFVQDEITLGGGHFLTPGVRAVHTRQTAVDELRRSHRATTRSLDPSLHYLWQLDRANNLRASLTQTLKPPKFDDLSPLTESKAGTAADPDKSGNPALKPERAVGVELGWEHFLPHGGGVLGANVFHRDIQDMVERRTALEGTRHVERPHNVGDARVWGWELDARPQLDLIGLPELMLRLNYTRLYSRITDRATGLTTRIKDQPPYVYNVGFDWQLPRWEAAWGLNYNYTPRYLKNPTEPLKADDEAEQKLLDLYVMKRVSRELALRVTASNLLDMKKVKDKAHFRDNGRRDKVTTEVERGGRAFFVALEGRW